ncbi:MAG: flagellar basal body rod protein FlgC [Candidatus Zixiibacteriota bacterium]
MSGLFRAIDVSATGLSVQRRKMDVVAENIANAETTETKEGGPYRRKRLSVSETREMQPFKTEMARAQTGLAKTHSNHLGGKVRRYTNGVEMSKVDGKEVQDSAQSYRLVHDPGHPDANEDGFVKMPDVEIVTEMVDMIAASRAYEANTLAISSAKEMAKNALEL